MMPPDGQPPVTPLLAFAIASSVYRWMVMFGIVMLLYYFFSTAYGMGPDRAYCWPLLYVALSVAAAAGQEHEIYVETAAGISPSGWSYVLGAAGDTWHGRTDIGAVTSLGHDIARAAGRDGGGQNLMATLPLRTPGYTLHEVRADVGQTVHAPAMSLCASKTPRFRP